MTGAVVLPDRSIAERLARLPPEHRAVIVDRIPPASLERLRWAWPFWARPKQLQPDGEWDVWVVLCGRGWGKTRLGAEWVHEQVRRGARRVAIIGDTKRDARAIMVEGESGIMARADPAFRPNYEPTKGLITWPNGACATMFTAEEPEGLRGPQHDCGWIDEFGKYGKHAQDVWDMFSLGLRLGERPRALVTTTGRPIEALKRIIADPRTVTTRGSTWDNRANLAPTFIRTMLRKYADTRLGRQEIDGDILEDVEGAVFQSAWIEASRATMPELSRIVVGVDPAISTRKGNDETGIVVAGVAYEHGADERELAHVYVIADVSGKYTPDAWARQVIAAFRRYEADLVVVERDRGGDLVVSNLRNLDPTIAVKDVHARRSKETRIEPIAALYQRGVVHHVLGAKLDRLETEMLTWDPAKTVSPNRIDALAHAVWELARLETDIKRRGAEYVSLTAPSRVATPARRVLDDEDEDEDDDGPRGGRGW